MQTAQRSPSSPPTAPVMDAQALMRQLETLGHAVSHDLSAPLRQIMGYAEQLAQSPAVAADPEALETLTELQTEAERLKTLQQGMLEYIRLSTFATAGTSLPASELVETALSTLEDEIRESGATVHYDNLPAVFGHRGRLTRLFAHLLANAILYRADKNPEIRISARPAGERVEFCVEDNGIGIEDEFHTVIFTLFQRLHTAERYKGNGIGLSLAQKIAEAHQGTMWVESSPGKGSRFYFTLPKSQ